jgi:hypothetical protein
VFEGLFPNPYNQKIAKLLFTMAHWHALAKLRLHTDVTLEILDDVTTSLGIQLRHFLNTVCKAFNTEELPKEARSRGRRISKAKSNYKTNGSSTSKGVGTKQVSHTGRKAMSFNLNTYKIHALGDYVSHIKLFGTTDSYSTEPVSNFI